MLLLWYVMYAVFLVFCVFFSLLCSWLQMLPFVACVFDVMCVFWVFCVCLCFLHTWLQSQLFVAWVLDVVHEFLVLQIFSVISVSLIAICTHFSVHTVLKTSSVCRLVRVWWTWQKWWEKTREWCQQLSCGPTPISRRSSGGTPVSLPIFWPLGALSTVLALAGMHTCFLLVSDARTVVIEL